MFQHPLRWYARADLKISNAIPHEGFYFVSFIYDHPVFIDPIPLNHVHSLFVWRESLLTKREKDMVPTVNHSFFKL